MNSYAKRSSAKSHEKWSSPAPPFLQGWSSPEGRRGSTGSPPGPMEGEMRGLGLSASCGGARVTGLAGGGGVRGGPVSALARKKPKPRDDAAPPPRKRRSCPPAKTEGFNLRHSVCESVPCRPNRSAVGTGFSVWQLPRIRLLSTDSRAAGWMDSRPPTPADPIPISTRRAVCVC